MKINRSIAIVILFFLTPCLIAQDNSAKKAPQNNKAAENQPAARATLFDNVAEQLTRFYVDKEFRKNRLPAIIEKYRPLAEQAKSIEAQRKVIFEMLSHIPASHLGLFSKSSYKRVMAELFNKPMPTFGLELIEIGDQYFAHNVLEGGPADQAGIKIGDRVVSLDGQNVQNNKRLDFRTDDAYVSDPSVHYLSCERDDKLKFEIERTWGEERKIIEVTAKDYSAFEAAKASIRIIEKDNLKIGMIHFWFIHIRGVNKLLKETLESKFKDCDAVIVDLRGRGGNGAACKPMVDIMSGKRSNWKKPVVALIDGNSRSAKEVIAYLIRQEKAARLVGQRTAGAVIPASFKDVGFDTVLMFPRFRLGKFTDQIEGKGVSPHVLVEQRRPLSGAKDPIAEAGVREAVRMINAAKQKSQ